MYDHVGDRINIDQMEEEMDDMLGAFGQTLESENVGGTGEEELEGSNCSHSESLTEDLKYTRSNGRTDQLDDDGNSVFDENDDARNDDCKDLKSESGSRRKGKLRKSGLGSGDQFWAPSMSFSYKSCLSPGVARHKQIRRRNHHNQGRFRRQTGFQLVTAIREFLSDSISPWSISCIHMVVDLIVSLTHHCGVIVESTAIALYDLALLLLHRLTDVPRMKQDFRRVTDFTRHSGTAFLSWTGNGMAVARQAVVWGFCFLTAMVCLCSWVAKAFLERLSGERGRRWWLNLKTCRIVSACSAFCGRLWARLWRQSSAGETATPESPCRTERSQPGQELERLLALAQVLDFHSHGAV